MTLLLIKRKLKRKGNIVEIYTGTDATSISEHSARVYVITQVMNQYYPWYEEYKQMKYETLAEEVDKIRYKLAKILDQHYSKIKLQPAWKELRDRRDLCEMLGIEGIGSFDLMIDKVRNLKNKKKLLNCNTIS